ncbi:MAG: 50S ribosomal protein L18 [Candidatus Omnitrophica bacterium]|nr:50S ribosomal protein L18 [Candidatus Omnitrophota bacterium]
MKITGRKKRYLRGKKKLLGTEKRPRLCLYRSLNNLNAQLVDDVSGKTLLSVSTLDKDIKKNFKSCGTVKAAAVLGELFTQKAKQANITQVRFDRSGYLYHGRVKAFAETCLKQGMKF